METRKVQITGGSTYMITLPKKWAESVNLKAGVEVQMVPLAHNGMVLKPESVGDIKQKVGHFKLEDQDGPALVRHIISLYIAGYEVVKVEGEQITSSQRSTIRKTTQSLIGPEIVEESSQQIVIRNLSDLSELSIEETLSRIHQISRSMFQDSIKALLNFDKELALDVEDRDDDVDRLFLAISRRFRVMLYDVLAENGEDSTRVDYFDYQTAAKQLERIADHSTKIAETVSNLEEPVNDNISDQISKAAEFALKIIDEAINSLVESNIEAANLALNRGPEMDEYLLELNKYLRNLDAQSSQHLGIVSDSIDRVKEYGVNIAETALNSSCPLPGEVDTL